VLKGSNEGHGDDFLMAAASADNVEGRPVPGLGVMMESHEDGKYQNKLVNKIVGTKPKWHIKE